MSLTRRHALPTKPEIIVVLKPGAAVGPGPAAPAALAAPAAGAAPAAETLRALVHRHGASIYPIHQPLPEAHVAALAAPAASARQQLERFHTIPDAPEAGVGSLMTDLRGHADVETAYIKPPGQPPAMPAGNNAPAAPPAIPSFVGNQDYLDAAPTGIDARFAWTRPGGRGAGVRIIDCEWAWNFNHEDLATHCDGNVVGTPGNYDDDHGTSVSGVLIANDNGFGTTGIAPDATLATAAFDGTTGLSTSAVIMQAADKLSAGDIILLEIHRPGPNSSDPPNGQLGFIAIEWWPDDFHAIAYATAKGILVVEAAGNGSEDLDSAIYDTPAQGFPADWKNPFAKDGPQSGAILVGAGNPPAGTHGRNQDTIGFGETYLDRARCVFSNFGSRVDCQGWGWEVTTLGNGDLLATDHNSLYTDVFSGTSSASPIVTGALACLQGILRTAGKALLTPSNARLLLHQTGSPQQSVLPDRPATQHIGRRPDLRQLCMALGVDV